MKPQILPPIKPPTKPASTGSKPTLIKINKRYGSVLANVAATHKNPSFDTIIELSIKYHFL